MVSPDSNQAPAATVQPSGVPFAIDGGTRPAPPRPDRHAVLRRNLFRGRTVREARLPQIWAFIPVDESVLVVNDLITAVLLLGQFSFLQSAALLIPAMGYLFTALITISHGLTFPGLFRPSGLLGAGRRALRGDQDRDAECRQAGLGRAGRHGHRPTATGTGLGLSIISRIVDEHRGTIDLHSRPGEGAEFVLGVPCGPPETPW